ncbi:F0F1 ATP synthase subunit A [bacterium]|nr:F0F1 ATP synthase subunit A [bacterium]
MEHGLNLFATFLHIPHEYIHVFTGAFVGTLIIIAALIYRANLGTVEEELVPDGRLSLKNLFQSITQGVLELMESIIGHDAKYYFPIIGAVFVYVLFNNLLGAIPGFDPATGNVNTNYAVSIVVFVYYNYVGIREQGLVNYLKHFMGPVLWIAPLLFAIELVSHAVRPVTLAVRLYANLTGDHIVLGIFSGLVPLIVPIVFMAFGIFVALVQAFVFSLLSTIYIGLAVAHEEH